MIRNFMVRYVFKWKYVYIYLKLWFKNDYNSIIFRVLNWKKKI